MKNFMSFIAGALILATSLIGLLFMVGVGHAATYNFYFNNLEQGDHSTASPSLTVSGKKSKNKADTKSNLDIKNLAPEGAGHETVAELPKTESKTVTTTEKTTVETTGSLSSPQSAEKVEVKEAVSDSLRVPPAEIATASGDAETDDETE